MNTLYRFVIDHCGRILAVLGMSMIAPWIITYTIPIYWMNVFGIFTCTMIVTWILDFILWLWSKATE